MFGCTSLKSITVNALNPTYSSVDGVLFDVSHTALLLFPEGKGGAYTVPDTVTEIADFAFSGCSALTSVTIPSSVTGIGYGAFVDCTSLTAVSLSTGISGVADYEFSGCSALTNVMIPEGVGSIGDNAFSYCGHLSTVAIPGSVRSIAGFAFGDCTNLDNIKIPSSLTSIGDYAFSGCAALTSLYFTGDAPKNGDYVFDPCKSTAYHLPGTAGWGNSFAGRPTALWTLPYPLILNSSLGVQSNQLAFTVSWASNASVVVEASADLKNLNWSPVETNSINNGVVNFTDSEWTNRPSRFYRVRSQ